MAVYNNADNPCFSGRSLIRMAEGGSKFVSEVKKGDKVLHARGGAAVVSCVVATRCKSGLAKLVRLGPGLEITPWHPVRAKDGVWRFPCEVASVEVVECDAVYSLILEADSRVALENAGSHSVSGVVIGEVECATLGHGMEDDLRWVETPEWSGLCNVIRHEYFGSTKVIQDLSEFPGWSQGRISFSAGCLVRDENSGQLVSFKKDAVLSQEITSF